MKYPSQIAVFAALLNIGVCVEDLKFPPGFKFGVGTSAYQIEGGWNAADKSASIWDVYSHNGAAVDGSDGDVACDSYHQWNRDVEMLSELGVDFYRFSLSWPRILPSGYTNIISEDGVKYYNDLIDGMLVKGIEPIGTLYHWDLPQSLQDLGGWANPLIADWFADYARVAYQLFGDRVKIWVTINEPLIICEGSYTWGMLAPAIAVPDEVGTYICNKNVLLAHAKAWRVYDEEFRAQYNGQVSWSDHLIWYEPENENNTKLAELALQHSRRYSHPIYSKDGGWPPVIEKIIAEVSAKQGYLSSRLPSFTEEEIKLVRGTYDFFGLNFYMSRMVVSEQPGKTDYWPFLGAPDLGLKFNVKSTWREPSNMLNVTTSGTDAAGAHNTDSRPTGDGTQLPEALSYGFYPEGFRHILRWIKKEYGDIKIFITENGYPGHTKDVNDFNRINYMDKYLMSVLKAIKEDGVNVIGYTFWSLMDNYEWILGYTMKYGLYDVDFDHPNRTRTARQSAKYYSSIIKNRALVEPTGIDSTTDSGSFTLYAIAILLVIIIIVLCFCIYYKLRKKDRKLEPIATHVPLLEQNIKHEH